MIRDRRNIAAVALGGLLALAGVWLGTGSVFGATEHWVATWGCAPQLVEARNLPLLPGLSGSTLRQVVHVSIGGRRLRARFSNAFGDGPLTMEAVHVALSEGGSAVLPASDKGLAFRGARSVTILPGEAVWSDAFDFDLATLTNVAVTIRFGDVPAAVTGHPGSRTTSYLRRGDAVTAPDMAGAEAVQHWYVLTGIDAEADAGCAAVVALGDSITDGRGSTTDGNDRWTDDLALRLAAVETAMRTAVINEGIGGNAVLAGGLGPTMVARFDRDVLSESGARWVILFEGVNDIGGSHDPSVAAGLILAYGNFIEKAHGKGLRIYGATITPFGGSMYSTAAHESARQAVNTWIRTSGKFDAVIDFDLVVRDPSDPARLLPAYDTGDHLHLNPAGYRAMAGTVDLGLFGR